VRAAALSSRAGAVFQIPRERDVGGRSMADNADVDRLDLTPALALGAVAALEAIVYTGWVDESDDSLAVALNLLMTVPLALRRTHLTLVAVTVTVSTLYLLASELTPTVAGYAGVAWMLYLVGARASRRFAAVLGAVFLLNGVAPIGGDEAGLESAILLVVAITALALGGTRTLTSERDEALAEQAAMGERARIARELHDVVAHHISMIAAEADTARLATPGMPPDGERHLLSIRSTARDAMNEMRRVLGVLRDDAGAEAEHAPQPGLDRIDELIEAARDHGAEVRLIVHGTVAPLARGVDLAAYRIVQESLTNARRHAPGARVEVELGYGEDVLRLRVRDRGPGPSGGRGGHGLAGMRERAAAAGGTLRAGAAEGGGFAVEAELPL
jgi:signal transduction histidine kinase